jgi:hypothetical protein
MLCATDEATAIRVKEILVDLLIMRARKYREDILVSRFVGLMCTSVPGESIHAQKINWIDQGDNL